MTNQDLPPMEEQKPDHHNISFEVAVTQVEVYVNFRPSGATEQEREKYRIARDYLEAYFIRKFPAYYLLWTLLDGIENQRREGK